MTAPTYTTMHVDSSLPWWSE